MHFLKCECIFSNYADLIKKQPVDFKTLVCEIDIDT